MLCMVVVACVNEFKNSPLHYQMNTKTQQYHQLNKEKFSFSYFILFFSHNIKSHKIIPFPVKIIEPPSSELIIVKMFII